uniref:Uncharacterized protein n=1 Tax=Trichogramma kaykai TaxID=54128 RepID=A0ABD2W4A9_9HYME
MTCFGFVGCRQQRQQLQLRRKKRAREKYNASNVCDVLNLPSEAFKFSSYICSRRQIYFCGQVGKNLKTSRECCCRHEEEGDDEDGKTCHR